MLIINSINKFLLSDKGIFYNIKNELFLDFKSLKTINNVIINIKNYDKKIFLESFDKDGFEITNIYNIDTQILESEKRFIVRDSQAQYFSYLTYDEEYNSIFRIFNSNENKLYNLSILNINKYKIIKNSLVIVENNNRIALYDYLKNTNLWSYQFSFPKYYNELHLDYEETKLEKFIGIYDNKLWILFSGNRILVLDINTGEELYQFESLNKTLDTSFFINNCFLDETTGVIKILAYLYYIEIDTKTKNTCIKKEFKDFSMVNGSYYGGDIIYFVGNNKSKSISNNITGIFNTKTLEIEWTYELEIKDKFHFFIDVPQANDKYFGVKDSENTLYLFERE